MSFKKGDYVVYKKKGTYVIEDFCRQKVCSEYRDYYVLKSVYDSNATIYVPVDSEALVSQMESVLSPAEIEEIIEKSKGIVIEWTSDYLQRQKDFDEIFMSGDLSAVIALMNLLRKKKEDAIENKKKISAVDEKALDKSKKAVSQAFAFSLGIDKNNVIEYVAQKSV